MTIEDREQKFRKEVQSIGGTTYTPEMIARFISYWSEPNRAKKPKMRWETQKTWSLERRLALWARNNFDGIECFLTESQRTLAQKKHAFAVSLEPFLEKYGRDTLNEFYRYYAQPENKPNPTKLKWESEEFWELSARLSMWVKRNTK